MIVAVAIYVLSSEAINQYTTLLGWSLGFHENDSTARYLLSISPIIETLAIFAIPVGLISTAYVVGIKWRSSNSGINRIQRLIVFACLFTAILLGISTNLAAISDFNTLHGIT